MRVADLRQFLGDLLQNRRVVDGGRGAVLFAVGDLLHRAPQNLAGAGLTPRLTALGSVAAGLNVCATHPGQGVTVSRTVDETGRPLRFIKMPQGAGICIKAKGYSRYGVTVTAIPDTIGKACFFQPTDRFRHTPRYAFRCAASYSGCGEKSS